MASSDIDRALRDNALRDVFGHERLTAEQVAAIDGLDAGRDVFVVLPTGAGKSLCYQLPALLRHQQRRGVTIVVSPLVALMQDQVDALRRKGIAASFINALVPRKERERRIEAAKRGDLALLYVVPERFRRPAFSAALDGMNVALLAIDEAHCISSWGHDFRPDYRRLGEYRLRCLDRDGKPAQVLAATATATPQVEQDVIEQLAIAGALVVRRPVYRANLRLAAIDCHGITDKVDHLARLLLEVGGAALIYTGLIARGEAMRRELAERGIHLRFYNGDQPAAVRKRLSRAFIDEDEPALLATNAFGMGIDRPDVRLIVHCELPGSIEAWSQEIGRSGRDGGPCLCVALLDDDDLAIQQQHIRNAHPDAPLVQAMYDAIEEMGGDSAGWTEQRLRERFAGRDRRDHRPSTALRQLLAAGCVDGSVARGDLHVVAEPEKALLDQPEIDRRRHHALERLLAMWRLWRGDGCLWSAISSWFGESLEHGDCGWCSSEKSLADLRIGLAPRRDQLRAEVPRSVADLPFRVGDWLHVGPRMGQVVRIGGQPERRVLRVLMADSLREERVVLRDGGPDVRKVQE